MAAIIKPIVSLLGGYVVGFVINLFLAAILIGTLELTNTSDSFFDWYMEFGLWSRSIVVLPALSLQSGFGVFIWGRSRAVAIGYFGFVSLAAISHWWNLMIVWHGYGAN